MKQNPLRSKRRILKMEKKMVEVEFRCTKCDRIAIELWPEDTDFDNLDADFEHDFDCRELEELEENE